MGTDHHKWDSDRRGLVGMDLGSDQHKWDSENGSVLVFYLFIYLFFGFVGMDFGSGGC